MLLALALVLAGCGGGGGGPQTGLPGPRDPPTTTGPGGVTNPTPTPSPGQAAGIEVGGPSLGIPGPGQPVSFGEVAVGSLGAPQVLELRLGTSFAATVVGVRIEGDGSFRLSEDRCSGAELPAGGAGGCVLAIVFGPLREGVAQAGLEVRMTHTCTSTTYQPCSWDPQREAKNFTRVVLQGGQVAFSWTTLVTLLRGLGTAASPATT